MESKIVLCAQEETLRLKRIAAASEKPHDTPSYSSTTVTAVCISQKKTLSCTENDAYIKDMFPLGAVSSHFHS